MSRTNVCEISFLFSRHIMNSVSAQTSSRIKHYQHGVISGQILVQCHTFTLFSPFCFADFLALVLANTVAGTFGYDPLGLKRKPKKVKKNGKKEAIECIKI